MFKPRNGRMIPTQFYDLGKQCGWKPCNARLAPNHHYLPTWYQCWPAKNWEKTVVSPITIFSFFQSRNVRDNPNTRSCWGVETSSQYFDWIEPWNMMTWDDLTWLCFIYVKFVIGRITSAVWMVHFTWNMQTESHPHPVEHIGTQTSGTSNYGYGSKPWCLLNPEIVGVIDACPKLTIVGFGLFNRQI
jgi:hypothetical protein